MTMPKIPLLLLTLLPLLPEPRAQSEAQLELGRRLAASLAGPDYATLADMADLELRSAERIARGLDAVSWDQLDELDRLGRTQLVLREWAESAQGFNQRATLTLVEVLQDPDQGLGPVPDRSILRLTLRHQSSGQYRQLLVTLTPGLRVLEIAAGRPYHPDADPAGEAGLQPQAILTSAPPAAVVWPADTGADEREVVTALVDELLAAPPGQPQALARERLHRNPQAAASALVERLVELDGQPDPDVDGQTRLVEALEQVTGRDTPWLAAPPTGMDPSDWRARNHATVVAWLRWQVTAGWTFVATEIVEPIEPTQGEGSETGEPPEMDRWTARLLEQRAAAEAAARGETGAAPPDPPPAASAPPPAAPPPADPAAPAGHAEPAAVVPRKLGPRDILFTAAADLRLHWRGRQTTGRALDAELQPAQREALNAWAEVATRLDLTVLGTGRTEHLVLAFKASDEASQAAAWLDDAAVRLAHAVPLLEGREQRTIVALVFDPEDSRSEAWGQLLDDLARRQLLFAETATQLRESPAGLLRRSAGLFLQPTWDMAGNASAGDDEFRFGNEVAGKFAQCLLTTRCGELPPVLLWGLDYVAELSLFESVYQFDHEGFVATGDHFDWPVKALQALEKGARSKSWSPGALAARHDDAGRAIEAQVVTWAVLAWLIDKDPPRLAALLTDLAALQAEVDKRGRSSVWKGDRDRTEQVLRRHLDDLDFDAISRWLER